MPIAVFAANADIREKCFTRIHLAEALDSGMIFAGTERIYGHNRERCQEKEVYSSFLEAHFGGIRSAALALIWLNLDLFGCRRGSLGSSVSRETPLPITRGSSGRSDRRSLSRDIARASAPSLSLTIRSCAAVEAAITAGSFDSRPATPIGQTRRASCDLSEARRPHLGQESRPLRRRADEADDSRSARP